MGGSTVCCSFVSVLIISNVDISVEEMLSLFIIMNENIWAFNCLNCLQILMSPWALRHCDWHFSFLLYALIKSDFPRKHKSFQFYGGKPKG